MKYTHIQCIKEWMKCTHIPMYQGVSGVKYTHIQCIKDE